MNRLSNRERAIIHSFWGQLIDLSCGQFKELVIQEGLNADLLRQIIKERIEVERDLDKVEAEEIKSEELRGSNSSAGRYIIKFK
jgi:hypothetical protein